MARWLGKKRRTTRVKHEWGKMNPLEQRFYTEYLLPRLEIGEIEEVTFEGVTFRIAEKCTYTPDFMVVYQDCIRVIEVKGFLEEDALVKWKGAAERFPYFQFSMVFWDSKKKEWKWREYDKALGV